jgi:hypothetical protein
MNDDDEKEGEITPAMAAASNARLRALLTRPESEMEVRVVDGKEKFVWRPGRNPADVIEARRRAEMN